ncbi:MAG: CHAD domain-containing protein, partial [Armatimonadota bacterium]|nr:CHAD domain-containing protein [Armatimonadota bacterium]
EIFSPVFEERLKEHIQVVRELQEMLGDIHDADVWLVQLPHFLEEEARRTREYFGHTRPMRRIAAGIHHFEKDRREFRARRYREFVEVWEKLRQQEVWARLRQELRGAQEAGS